MISVLLYSSFFSSSKTVQVSQEYINRDVTIGIITNQFTRDISGVFIPTMADVVKTGSDQPPVSEKKDLLLTSTEKEPLKPFTHLFTSINKQDNLDFVTFITNNPLRVYTKIKNTKVTPSLVRVVYRLVPEGTHFNLERQESEHTEFESFTSAQSTVRAYQVASHIKRIALEYVYPEIPEEPEKKPGQAQEASEQKEKKPPVYKVVKVWGSDEQSKDKNTKVPPIPQFIKMNVSLWNSKKDRDKEYVLWFEIPAFSGLQNAKPQTVSNAPK